MKIFRNIIGVLLVTIAFTLCLLYFEQRRDEVITVTRDLPNGEYAIFYVKQSQVEFVKQLNVEKLRAKSIAISALTFLRQGTDNYLTYLSLLKPFLDESQITLADVGTSDEELAALKIKGAKIAAVEAIEALRKGNRSYEAIIEMLYKYYLPDGHITLTDIGTNAEELEQLKRKCAKLAAEYDIDLMRRTSLGYARHVVKSLNHHLADGHITLTDIGSSTKEVEQLTKNVN